MLGVLTRVQHGVAHANRNSRVSAPSKATRADAQLCAAPPGLALTSARCPAAGPGGPCGSLTLPSDCLRTGQHTGEQGSQKSGWIHVGASSPSSFTPDAKSWLGWSIQKRTLSTSHNGSTHIVWAYLTMRPMCQILGASHVGCPPILRIHLTSLSVAEQASVEAGPCLVGWAVHALGLAYISSWRGVDIHHPIST